MTFDTFLETIRKLRDQSRGSEEKLFEFLLKAEDEHRALWEGSGFAKFAFFLAAYDICDVKRFEFYKLALTAFGVERMKVLGVEASITAYKATLPKPARGPRRNFIILEQENRELRAQLDATRAQLAAARAQLDEVNREKDRLQKRLAKQEKAA